MTGQNPPSDTTADIAAEGVRLVTAGEMPLAERLRTIPAAAAQIGLNERTLRRWVAANKVPTHPDPIDAALRLVDPVEVLAYQERQRTADTRRRSVTGQIPDGDRSMSGQENLNSGSDRTVTGQDSRADALAAELESLRQEVATIEGERDQARQIAASWQQRAQALQQQVEQLTTDLSEARGRAAQMEVRAAGAEGENRQLVETVADLRTRLDAQTEALRAEQEAARDIRLLLADERQRARALEEQRRPALPAEVEEQPAKRPWWKWGKG